LIFTSLIVKLKGVAIPPVAPGIPHREEHKRLVIVARCPGRREEAEEEEEGGKEGEGGEGAGEGDRLMRGHLFFQGDRRRGAQNFVQGVY
jgi:hypothetical protein